MLVGGSQGRVGVQRVPGMHSAKGRAGAQSEAGALPSQLVGETQMQLDVRALAV